MPILKFINFVSKSKKITRYFDKYCGRKVPLSMPQPAAKNIELFNG